MPYSSVKDKFGRWVYVFLLPAALLNIEYGIYSMVLVILFHEFRENKKVLIISFIAATIIFSITQQTIIQLEAILLSEDTAEK